MNKKKNAFRIGLFALILTTLMCSLVFTSPMMHSARAEGEATEVATEAPVITEAPVATDAPVSSFSIQQSSKKDDDHGCSGNEEWDETSQSCKPKDNGNPHDCTTNPDDEACKDPTDTGCNENNPENCPAPTEICELGNHTHNPHCNDDGTTKTPEPSETVEPSETPDPSETPCVETGNSTGDEHGQGCPPPCVGSEQGQQQGEPDCEPTEVPTDTPTSTATPCDFIESIVNALDGGDDDCATETPTVTPTLPPTEVECEDGEIVNGICVTQTPPTPTDTPTSTATPCGFVQALFAGFDGENECETPTPTATATQPPVESTPPAPEQANRAVNSCKAELILHVDAGDLYSDTLSSNYALATKVNLTETFDFAVSNPDGFNCYIAAEASRNGQTDIALFADNGAFVRWLTDSPENDLSPTWLLNGHLMISKNGELYEIDIMGNMIADRGKGTVPVVSNYTGVLAYTAEDGSLMNNGTDTGIDGYALNYTPLGELVYYSANDMWLLHLDGSSEKYAGGFDAAPDPHKNQFNGLVSLANSTDVWSLNPASSVVPGSQQDWWFVNQ